MANTAITTSNAFEQIQSLSQLHIVRQIVFMILLAGGIALGTAIVLWSRTPDLTPLYMNLTSRDSAEIAAALEQNGIQYKVNTATGMISVPADSVQQVRLQMANMGLPRSSSMGYDMLSEEQSLGTSSFIEQARFNRALEQELVATIKLIRGVRAARVHLSVPRQASFLRNSNKASASVMLDVIGGQTLSDMQIAGIVHLVASSVAGLEVENVSVVDQRGTLLSSQNDSDFNSGSEQLRYTRRLEKDYSDRIVDILTPIVGEGKVRAQVSADLDFTYIETTKENYDPDSVIVRSEQTEEERVGGQTGSASVEPGTLSPNPPAINPDGSNPAAQSASAADTKTPAAPAPTRINSTRNYEVDRSVSYTRSVPGTVNRLTVAVLVDLGSGDQDQAQDNTQTAARVQRITQLVKDTIGYNEVRGDSVNVIDERFSPPETFELDAEEPIWQQAWVLPTLKQAAAGVVVLFLIFGVLRPALRSTVGSPRGKGGIGAKRIALPGRDIADDIGDDKVSLSDEDMAQKAIAAPAKSIYDENLSVAQNLVEKEPARAARMIKEWVSND